jgi:hypothetical protein
MSHFAHYLFQLENMGQYSPDLHLGNDQSIRKLKGSGALAIVDYIRICSSLSR